MELGAYRWFPLLFERFATEEGTNETVNPSKVSPWGEEKVKAASSGQPHQTYSSRHSPTPRLTVSGCKDKLIH